MTTEPHLKGACLMTPDDEFTAALSAVVNACQSLAPTAREMRHAVGHLLFLALTLENDADRLVHALKRLQPPNADAS